MSFFGTHWHSDQGFYVHGEAVECCCSGEYVLLCEKVGGKRSRVEVLYDQICPVSDREYANTP
jgi:hypothetical protein